MLETLDTVDWARLSSCYESAEAIPYALRNLLSDDSSVRRGAYGTLKTALEHQGGVFEASIAAVPFLLEIASVPQLPDLIELIRLLSYIGCQGYYLAPSLPSLELRLLFKEKSPEEGAFRALAQDRRRRSEEAHQAVRKGLPLFLALLDHPDAALRMELTFLLACFNEDRSLLLPPLLSRLQQETDETVVACFLLCLGRIGLPSQDIGSLLLRYAAGDDLTLVRFTASLALCIFSQQEVPQEAVSVVLRALADPSSLEHSYATLPDLWKSDGVCGHALYALDQLLASPFRGLILHEVIGLFPLMDYGVDLVADLLLYAAFYQERFSPHASVTFESLDPLQQAILRSLVANETLWSWPTSPGREGSLSLFSRKPNSLWGLEQVGLPATLQALQAFIH